MGQLKNHAAGGLACLGFWAVVMAGPGLAQELVLEEAPASEEVEVEEADAQAEPVTVLDQLVVSASGYAQTLPDAPATISVIDGEQINSKPYASVTDVLRDVPGVVVSAPSARSGAETITIRGLGENYVLTLVDGRPVGNSREATYNGFGSGQSWSYLPPPSAIERIEVIRGPMSSLYGSAASGGVINIITKPVSDVWSGTLTLGTSTYQDSDAGSANEGRFYLSGPLIGERLGLTLYGSRHERSRKRMLVAGRGGTITEQAQDIERKSLGARLTWAITDMQQLDFETSYNGSDTKTVATGGTPGGIKLKRMNYSLSHRIGWGNGHETTSFLSYENVDFSNGDNVSGYDMLNLNTKTNMSLGRHDLTFGMDYIDETTRHSPNRVNVDPKMTRWQWALFGEDNFHLTDDLTLTLGLRHDQNERYGSHVTPRLYAVWHATPSLTIKGGVSGGYKTPTLKQADSDIFEPSGGDGRARDQGNTDLKPETSTNYEIGAVWESASGVQLGLTAYHTRFKDKIERETICNNEAPIPGLPSDCGMNGPGDPIKWISQYVNRDAAELNGVEMTADFSVRDVDVTFNYTYADSKITKGDNVGETFNSSPRHIANLGLDWTVTDKFSLWGNAQYRSATTDSGSNQISEHTIFDIGADYSFNDNAMLSLAVYNVGDKSFGLTHYNDGRRFYAGLTTRF